MLGGEAHTAGNWLKQIHAFTDAPPECFLCMDGQKLTYFVLNLLLQSNPNKVFFAWVPLVLPIPYPPYSIEGL